MFWRFSLAVVVIVALALPVAAQVQNGALTGTVTDPTGAVIPNAEVKVAREGGGVERTVMTNAAGVYRVSELPVGHYTVSISAEGFKTANAEVEVEVGTITRLAAVALELGARAEVVTVEAGAALIQTETGQLSERVQAEQISNLPLNGRNVYSLIQLAPGAANATGVSFENGQGTVVNGMRPNFNGFLINGSANRQLSGGANALPNPDLVEEFQMLTLNTSAQYGNVAGSINNLVTKSGTNDFHGSAYWFFRNDVLDANEFFRNLNASSDPTSLDFALNDPKLVRFNQFGATATGRIIKDRLFFTGSYEASRFNTQADAFPIVIETPEWHQAITAFANANPTIGQVAGVIYNDWPTTTVGSLDPVTGTLAQFVGTGNSGEGFTTFAEYLCPDFTNATVASNLMALVGVTAQDQLDWATVGCTGAPPAVQAGFLDTFWGNGTPGSGRSIPFQNDTVLSFGSQSQTYGDLANGDRASARFDYNSQNHHLFGELWYYETRDSIGGANANSGKLGIATPFEVHAPNFSGSWVWTVTPTVINDLRVGFSRNAFLLSVGSGSNGLPSINFDDGVTGFGAYNGYPQFFFENVYSYSDMVSITKGEHNMKFGVDYKDNRENSTFNVGRPSYYFFDQLFFAVDAPYGEVAGTDPGFISGSNLARLDENNRAWQNYEVGIYFQDDWKVTPRLTLNLGVRWDYFNRHKERFDRITNFVLPPGSSLQDRMLHANIVPPAVAPAGLPECVDTNPQVVLAGICGPGGFAVTNSLGNPDWNNWGPRLGLAWDPFGTGKTVIRGGWALSYEGTLYNPLSNSRWNPPFFSFNFVANDLLGDTGYIVYGPTTCADPTDATTCAPSGDTPDWRSGATTNGVLGNIGSGPGVLSDGNIQGWFPGAPDQAFLTGIVPRDLPFVDPKVMSWHVGFQHELMTDMVMEVNYVGTRGYNLFRAQQINRSRGNYLDPATDCGGSNTIIIQGESVICRGRRRLNPNYGTMRAWFNTNDSWYHGLQASVRKRMSHGFMFQANYTWSHSLDTGSGWHSGTTTANGSAAGDAYSLDLAHPELDKGNSTFDIRHRFVGSFVWDLPFGENTTGGARKLLQGWIWNANVSAQSGAHWTPYCASSFPTCDWNADGEFNDRPDVGSGGTSFDPSKDQWANGWFSSGSFDSALGGSTPFFSVPCLGCNGNFPRNSLEGPGQFVVDTSLFKDTPITERVNIQFRFEVFNIFNRANFLLPSSATGANFANRTNSSIFGASAGTLNSRNIQFGLKVIW